MEFTERDSARQAIAPEHIPDAIGLVRAVYERGQTLEALRRAEDLAPLQMWRGVQPCVLASRIAANAGAPRLATKLAVRAWRLNKRDPEALAQYSYEMLGRRGPCAVWQSLRTWQDESRDPPEHVAELFALKGRAAAMLRDFANAEALIARADAIDPKRSWIYLQRASLLEYQDRITEALEVAQAACALHPHKYYRSGVQSCAYLLQLLDRDADAIDLLLAANAELESAPVAGQLYSLLSESNRWVEAQTALDRFVEMSPLLEPAGLQWVSAQRARLAYRMGHRAEAARFASGLTDDFHKRFAERLLATQPAIERVQLDVNFVRQHFKTCAPATLAALGRFWRMPAEHLKLAEEICYDGTPTSRQRDWAEKNGWYVREFRVTYETAVALLERGIPFAVTVVDAASAHMMAVMGFDRTRGTLLFRDPGQPYAIEWDAVEFLKRYEAFGPHGMVFVPSSASSRLEGLSLPDAVLYDAYHVFSLALSRYDRANAVAAFLNMTKANANAALVWDARLDLAFYDCNVGEQVRCLQKLAERFPDHPARQLRRFACLPDASRDTKVAQLRSACARSNADPALFIALSRALQGDARHASEARRFAKRALRARPMDPAAISCNADVMWEADLQHDATEWYRFAANLDGFQERLYQSWYVACRQTGHAAEALEYLQDRFARFGARSDQPALTLAWAFTEMEQPARARQVLDQAVRLRPDDGYLLLRAATLQSSVNEPAEAERLLGAASGKVRDSDWLRGSMQIAENGSDFAKARDVARELLNREPLALDAHATISRALARLEGVSAAIAELKQQCERSAHHYGLQRMLVELSRDAGPVVVESHVRKLLQLEPSDAWAYRELAVALTLQQRGEDALQAATESVRIEPWNSYSFSVLGTVHRQMGSIELARTALRQAITLSADNSDAVNVLLELARNDVERSDDLALVESELTRQVVRGDGLLAFVEAASSVIDGESLLGTLKAAHAVRPDLWHAWSALILQLGQTSRFDEALSTAEQGCERFPHLPRTWLDLARVHRWRNEPDAEIAAAERAFAINPSWNQSALALTAALTRRGRMDEARSIYQRALHHSPHDPQLHAFHANLLWRLRDAPGAFAAVERALRLAPTYEWAWNQLIDWCAQSAQPQRTTAIARALTVERPGDARVWLMLAKVLAGREASEERLTAVDRALQLDMRSTEAWDFKSELLASVERFDEAILACEQGIAKCLADAHILRGRMAWIDAQRRRLPEAIQAMRKLLMENAGYIWGWHRLSEWLLQQGNKTEATVALERLQLLRPHDGWVSRELGSLKLSQNDRAGARRAFSAALVASPSDTNAAHNLLDLQLRDSDLTDAKATLAVMRTHQPGSATLAAEILLRLHERDHDTALSTLEELSRAPDPDPWPFEAAVNAFIRAGLTAKAVKVIKRAIKSGSCNLQCGVAAVRLLMAQGSQIAAGWLFVGLPPGEMQRYAAVTIVASLAKGQHKYVLDWVLWRRRNVIFQDDAAWGQAGYALTNFRRMRRVATWMADWRRRNNVQPWMLFNYCLALRHLGRFTEAANVARYAVATWGHREGATDMHCFVAIEEALIGNVDVAREHLKHVVVRADVPYDQQMSALTNALIRFHDSPSEERRRVFSALRDDLSAHFSGWSFVRSMGDVRRTFRRAASVFVDGGAGPAAWLWCNWKLYWQWSLLGLAPLILVMPAVAVTSLPPILPGLIIYAVFRAMRK